MSTRLCSSILLAATVSLALGIVPVFGQEKGFKPPDGPVPRTADGKPDLSGVWDPPYVPDMSKDGRNQKGAGELPLTEWGQSQWKSYDPSNGDYTGACLPFGLVRSINSPMPMQIVQNNKYISMDFEVMNWFLNVPIDGRKHRDQNPTWAGDSVGHWEGDTLVIDSVNFNGKTRIDTIGHPQSDRLHVIQRWTRTDLGHIAFEMTIDDPKAYTKPWKNTRTFTLRPDWEIMEYSCEENNKSLWEGRIKVPKY
jgi:hypothetical protein